MTYLITHAWVKVGEYVRFTFAKLKNVSCVYARAFADSQHA